MDSSNQQLFPSKSINSRNHPLFHISPPWLPSSSLDNGQQRQATNNALNRVVVAAASSAVSSQRVVMDHGQQRVVQAVSSSTAAAAMELRRAVADPKDGLTDPFSSSMVQRSRTTTVKQRCSGSHVADELETTSPIVGSPSSQPRRSSRNRRIPNTFQDYYCDTIMKKVSSPHPLSNVISYSHLDM
nr:zinc finger BED domain-containing protein RICESLEEPER 2-like [Ipomoea batatas]